MNNLFFLLFAVLFKYSPVNTVVATESFPLPQPSLTLPSHKGVYPKAFLCCCFVSSHFSCLGGAFCVFVVLCKIFHIIMISSSYRKTSLNLSTLNSSILFYYFNVVFPCIPLSESLDFQIPSL